jgi:hypothetical protein
MLSKWFVPPIVVPIGFLVLVSPSQCLGGHSVLRRVTKHHDAVPPEIICKPFRCELKPCRNRVLSDGSRNRASSFRAHDCARLTGQQNAE